MSGLWRKNAKTPEGKYPVVLRRDGTIPECAWFVMLQRDPYAPAALRAYADAAEADNADPEYVADVRALADEWQNNPLSGGDPDAPPHRTDDPDVLHFPDSLREYKRAMLNWVSVYLISALPADWATSKVLVSLLDKSIEPLPLEEWNKVRGVRRRGGGV